MLKLKTSGKIERYNVPKGCCVNEFCDKHGSYYVNLELKGFSIHLVFCKKHYDEFENLVWDEA